MTTIFLGPGVDVLEDDGDPHNNRSQLRRADGTIIPFDHPVDVLEVYDTGDPDATLVINLTESLGAADLFRRHALGHG